MYNGRSWLKVASTELHNITNPHCFVLKEASSDDVVLKYKHWSSDKLWRPSDVTEEGVIVLEV